MFTGTGSQIGTNGRWGDYSMTTIDPTDGTSFWTVGEYKASPDTTAASVDSASLSGWSQ